MCKCDCYGYRDHSDRLDSDPTTPERQPGQMQRLPVGISRAEFRTFLKIAGNRSKDVEDFLSRTL